MFSIILLWRVNKHPQLILCVFMNICTDIVITYHYITCHLFKIIRHCLVDAWSIYNFIYCPGYRFDNGCCLYLNNGNLIYNQQCLAVFPNNASICNGDICSTRSRRNSFYKLRLFYLIFWRQTPLS